MDSLIGNQVLLFPGFHIRFYISFTTLSVTHLNPSCHIKSHKLFDSLFSVIQAAYFLPPLIVPLDTACCLLLLEPVTKAITASMSNSLYSVEILSTV